MPSSWLLSVGTLIASSIISPAVAHPEPGPGHSQGYQLVEKWQGKSFMDHIEFFNAPDPTNGYVNYLDQKSAENAGLFKVNSGGSLYMGVDHKTTLDPSGPGRDSVRIESKKFYEEGLYIVDIKHMPGSICGTWPAFWSVGPKWPDNGEIDIIEGVNMHNANEIVLHTSGSCALSEGADMSGSLTSSECGDASGTIGCVVKAENGTSGTPFNKQGGGVYAMERAPDFMKIWYFPRGAIPKSIAHGKPDTASFGTPMANLQGSCDFKERFTAQKLIFNTDFCGDWAGGIYGDDGCPMSDPSDSFKSCETFVATNPEEFKEAYWEINSVQIFQAGLSPHASSESSTTSAIETAPADTASATKIPATSDVESAETTAPAPPSSVSSEPPAPETDLPAPATSAKAAESTLAFETSPAAPETTAAAPAASTAPETHGASIPVSRSTVLSTSTSTRTVPRSTVYTTSTTTICNKSAAAIGGGHASAPTGSVAGDEDAHETLDNASSTLSGNVRMGAAASETFATGERAATSSSAPSTAEAIAQSAASTPCETVPVPESSQPAPVPASSDVPESGPVSTEVPPAAHVPASSEHSPATSVAPETTHGAPIPAPTEASQDVQVAPSSETNHDAPTPASTQAPQAAQVIPSPEITHDAPIPASTEAPQAAHVPASSESSPAGPSGADAVGNSNAASSSAPSTTPSASLSSPASSGSPVAYDPSSSSTGSSPSNSHALFTGAASRLSVGATGLVGVLAVAVLV